MPKPILSMSKGEHAFDVVMYSVHEALDQLFTVKVVVHSSEEDIPFADIVGRAGTFAIGLPDRSGTSGDAADVGGDEPRATRGAPDLAGIGDHALRAAEGSLRAGASLEAIGKTALSSVTGDLTAYVTSAARRAASDLATNVVGQALGKQAGQVFGTLAGDVAGQAAGNLLGDVGLGPRGQPIDLGKLAGQAARDALGQAERVALGELQRLLGGAGVSALVGPRAAVTDTMAQVPARVWSGVASSFKLEGVSPEGLSTYSVVLRPLLWLATQKRQSRVFQRLSVPEIVSSILAEWSTVPKLNLDLTRYPKLDYRAQYLETDYDFVARLLQQEGISYSFQQTPEGATQLVLDARPQTSTTAPLMLPYVNETSKASGSFVTSVSVSHQLRPGRVTLRDLDRRRPRTAVEGEARIDDAGHLEAILGHDVYRPGSSQQLVAEEDARDKSTPVVDDKGYCRSDEERCRDLATLRLEEARTGRRQIELTSNDLTLAPGAIFAIGKHPSRDLQGALLVTGTRVFGTWQSCAAQCTAIPAEDPFRPARVTEKRLIAGPQLAKVTGPGSEPVHTNELGDVRVAFPWDASGKRDAESSRWVPVNQGYTGQQYGMLALPRVGNEVLVQHVLGDPDHPVVVGQLHNALTPTPQLLPASKTVTTAVRGNVLGAAAVPRQHALALDDKKGKETFETTAPMSLNVEAGADHVEQTNDNRRAEVHEDLEIVVGGRVLIRAGRDVHLRAGEGGHVTLNTTDAQIDDARTHPPAPPPLPPAETYKPAPTIEEVKKGATLARGMEGPAVTQLQQALNKAGFQVPVTGRFDAATEDAVKKFKSAHGLTGDPGVVGPTTLESLQCAGGQSCDTSPTDARKRLLQLMQADDIDPQATTHDGTVGDLEAVADPTKFTDDLCAFMLYMYDKGWTYRTGSSNCRLGQGKSQHLRGQAIDIVAVKRAKSWAGGAGASWVDAAGQGNEGAIAVIQQFVADARASGYIYINGAGSPQVIGPNLLRSRGIVDLDTNDVGINHEDHLHFGTKSKGAPLGPVS